MPYDIIELVQQFGGPRIARGTVTGPDEHWTILGAAGDGAIFLFPDNDFPVVGAGCRDIAVRGVGPGHWPHRTLMTPEVGDEGLSSVEHVADLDGPMYLVIFPEGTRYNPELTKVISASQTFAAQEGKTCSLLEIYFLVTIKGTDMGNREGAFHLGPVNIQVFPLTSQGFSALKKLCFSDKIVSCNHIYLFQNLNVAASAVSFCSHYLHTVPPAHKHSLFLTWMDRVYTKHRYNGPQGEAWSKGLPVLKHVLTPRIKATHVAFDSMKNYLDAIYDVTVAFEGTVDDKGQRKEAPSMAGGPRFHQSYLGGLSCTADCQRARRSGVKLRAGDPAGFLAVASV
eukprot:bmy_19435T0